MLNLSPDPIKRKNDLLIQRPNQGFNRDPVPQDTLTKVKMAKKTVPPKSAQISKRNLEERIFFSTDSKEEAQRWVYVLRWLI